MSISIENTVRLIVAASFLLLLAGCGLTAPRSSEGFADLDSLGMADTNRVLSLSLGPTVLRFAASHVDDDPEVRELLRSLDGIRVRIYEVTGDVSRVAGRMDRMSAKMQDHGWEPVMLMRDEGETVYMLLRTIDGRIHGMTVMVVDDSSEAVIVNLMGEIEPERFSDVMVALDVDGVDEVEVAAAMQPEAVEAGG